MTLVYHYTPGVNAVGNSGPFDTARAGVEQRTAPATRQGVFDAIREALAGPTGAGWTETAASTPTHRVYTSPGESGDENLVLTLSQGLRTSPDVRYVHFGCAHSVDASGAPQNAANFGVSIDADHSLNLPLDFAVEFQILASRDWIWVFLSRTSNQESWVLFGGLLRRVFCNTNVLTVGPGGASPGANALVPTTVNPATLGVRVGDNLTVIDQAVSVTPAAENVLVTSLETTGVRVARLAGAYTAGSRIGDSPNPIVTAAWTGNQSLDDGGTSVASSNFLSCYRFATPGDAELMPDDSDGQFDVSYVNFKLLGKGRQQQNDQEGLGVLAQPEVRTNRFLCPAILVQKGVASIRSTAPQDVGQTPGRATLGVLPGLYLYPGSASYLPHDNFVRTRNVTSAEDYVPARFAGSSTGSDEHYALGPTPL